MKKFIIRGFSIETQRTVYAATNKCSLDPNDIGFLDDHNGEITARDDAQELSEEAAQTFINCLNEREEYYYYNPDGGRMWVKDWEMVEVK